MACVYQLRVFNYVISLYEIQFYHIVLILHFSELPLFILTYANKTLTNFLMSLLCIHMETKSCWFKPFNHCFIVPKVYIWTHEYQLQFEDLSCVAIFYIQNMYVGL